MCNQLSITFPFQRVQALAQDSMIGQINLESQSLYYEQLRGGCEQWHEDVEPDHEADRGAYSGPE